MLYQTSYTSIGIDTVLCYYLISSPVWSSATNWTAGFCKIVPDDYEYTRPCKYVVVSPNKRIITTSHDQGQTYESVEGSTLAESFLTFWDNNIDYFAVKVSGVNYVDGTSAEIIGKVLNHSGNVTLFYDTSDKGEDVSAWSFSKDCGLQYDNTDPGLSNGYFTVSVDGLTPNTEYVFRFYMSSLSTWV